MDRVRHFGYNGPVLWPGPFRTVGVLRPWEVSIVTIFRFCPLLFRECAKVPIFRTNVLPSVGIGRSANCQSPYVIVGYFYRWVVNVWGRRTPSVRRGKGDSIRRQGSYQVGSVSPKQCGHPIRSCFTSMVDGGHVLVTGVWKGAFFNCMGFFHILFPFFYFVFGFVSQFVVRVGPSRRSFNCSLVSGQNRSYHSTCLPRVVSLSPFLRPSLSNRPTVSTSSVFPFLSVHAVVRYPRGVSPSSWCTSVSPSLQGTGSSGIVQSTGYSTIVNSSSTSPDRSFTISDV